jgi:hypothetical protein
MGCLNKGCLGFHLFDTPELKDWLKGKSRAERKAIRYFWSLRGGRGCLKKALKMPIMIVWSWR